MQSGGSRATNPLRDLVLGPHLLCPISLQRTNVSPGPVPCPEVLRALPIGEREVWVRLPGGECSDDRPMASRAWS